MQERREKNVLYNYYLKSKLQCQTPLFVS